MKRQRLFLILLLLAGAVLRAERPRISEDRDLLDLDLSDWDCLGRTEGTAKNPDSIERNRLKNRSAVDLTGIRTEPMDNTTFLKHVGAFDAQTKGKRRKDLTQVQRQQLETLEKEIVSLSGWLVLAYAGPPESTNCGSTDFHDWHLELYQNPADHPPRIGDPTPIICEITPRTQRAIYRDNIRVQALAGFFRHPDLTDEPTGHPARKIRVTGYLIWDDEHNGSADVGSVILRIGANKYHQPWRATAWEIHPVMKIEVLDDAAAQKTPAPATVSPALDEAANSTPRSSPTSPQFVTIMRPVKIKVRYGESVLPRGMKLPVISRGPDTVIVKFMDNIQTIPISSTDLQ